MVRKSMGGRKKEEEEKRPDAECTGEKGRKERRNGSTVTFLFSLALKEIREGKGREELIRGVDIRVLGVKKKRGSWQSPALPWAKKGWIRRFSMFLVVRERRKGRR